MFKERSRGQEKEACKGKKIVKRKKNCWVNVPHFHRQVFFSSSQKQGLWFSSTNCNSPSCLPFTSPPPVFQVDTKQILIWHFFSKYTFKYIHSVFQVYRLRVSVISYAITKLLTKIEFYYLTSFSLNQSGLSLSHPKSCNSIRGPSIKLRMPLSHNQVKCRTRPLPGESIDFVVGSASYHTGFRKRTGHPNLTWHNRHRTQENLDWDLTFFLRQTDSVNDFQTIFEFIIHQDKELCENIKVKLSVDRNQIQFWLSRQHDKSFKNNIIFSFRAPSSW